MKNRIEIADLILGYSKVEQINHAGYTGAIKEARSMSSGDVLRELEEALSIIEKINKPCENSNPEILKRNLRNISDYLKAKDAKEMADYLRN